MDPSNDTNKNIEVAFSMSDQQSQMLAQAVRALSQGQSDESIEVDSSIARRRPRRAASRKASKNLNKMVSLDDIVQIEEVESKNDDDGNNRNNEDTSLDNMDTAIRSNDIVANIKRSMKRSSKKINKTDEKGNKKRKSRSSDDDDAEFILVESGSDHESDDDDDMMIDNTLKEDLKLGQGNDSDTGFVEDEKTTKTRKKRGRKPKSHNKASPSKRQKPVSKKKSIFETKNKIIRALKDISGARDKVERIYGLNKDKLLQLAKIKEGFESHLFDFPKSNIDYDSRFYVSNEPVCNKFQINDEMFIGKETQYTQIDQETLKALFKYREEPLNVIIGEIDSSLQNGDKLDFPVFENDKRKGLVYNSGALITDIAWLNKEPSPDTQEHRYQYLAISLSQYMDNPSDPHLEMFDKENHISCFEIVEFDPITLAFNKIQTILHNFGDTWNLKWHVGYNSDKNIGLLTFVAQDGSFKALQIRKAGERDSPVIMKCETASISISLSNSNITCFDYISPISIVCGFKNGYVAEFDIFDSNHVPSYYHKIHETFIISIVVVYSPFEPTTVGTLAVDGYFHVFDPRDIYGTKCTVSRLRGSNIMPIVYVPQLSLLLFSDASNSLRTLTTKALFAPHNVISRESTVVSLGTAKFHPFSLTGTADGKIYIDNLSRKILTGIKNSTTIHKSLRLWGWDYDIQQKKYRLDHTYEVCRATNGEVNKVGIHPPGVSISAVKWNETIAGCKIYAFSNNAGLLTIESLPRQ